MMKVGPAHKSQSEIFHDKKRRINVMICNGRSAVSGR